MACYLAPECVLRSDPPVDSSLFVFLVPKTLNPKAATRKQGPRSPGLSLDFGLVVRRLGFHSGPSGQAQNFKAEVEA